jgi:16S rRNA (adenine1518-N6/adenine1519-N6)-dimethyltransferase
VSSHPALSADRLTPPSPGQLRRLLAAEHLRPRKALSQNFLTDAAALDAIVAAAELQPGDRVLEVGPGLGVLTRRLLAAGASVLAVEIDPRLAAWLRRELAEVPGFDLIEADALTLHPREAFPAESFKLVANIPYHITSPLLHAFLEGERPPDVSVLLVQAEVAERVAAPPGQMSYLSVFVQNLASAEVVARVPAAAFEPAPDVDSAVLRLRRRAEPPVPLGSGREPFYRIVQAGFRQRRKQIHNGLGRELPVGGGAVENALAACAIDGERRPQTLSVEEWACLATQLTPLLRRADAGGAARAERHARRGTAG